jgi:hypothetical protein
MPLEISRIFGSTRLLERTKWKVSEEMIGDDIYSSNVMIRIRDLNETNVEFAVYDGEVFARDKRAESCSPGKNSSQVT